MRTFVVLCLVAVAAAQYEYGAQSGGSIGGVGPDDFAAAIGGGVAPAPVQNDYETPAPAGTDFEKEFFTFTAPEGEFDDNNAAEKIAGSLKKNLRVVFIKGPENAALENAALQLAKSAAEDRTAIYVLNKQADIGDLASKLNNLNKNANSKPEVHFVKYRTDADAENAQRTIQAQYDTLPGSSSTTNGGAAPVLDFASKSAVRSSGSSSAAIAPAGSYIPPQSSYLPPGRRF
ncbi:uncharacterized protein LOC142242583 [Haematobia irritans]|uniref:uncharacterized protein LOC142242583 n=1 Tax=Haematobia irritans TaxID=7368 RepID=UPI003F4F9113